MRLPVGAWPRSRQASLVLHRSLTAIERRRTQHVAAYQRSPQTSHPWVLGWPLSLPDPRWVVSHIVERTARRARTFRLSDAECRELTDAVLVVLALEATP